MDSPVSPTSAKSSSVEAGADREAAHLQRQDVAGKTLAGQLSDTAVERYEDSTLRNGKPEKVCVGQLGWAEEPICTEGSGLAQRDFQRPEKMFRPFGQLRKNLQRVSHGCGLGQDSGTTAYPYETCLC